MKKKILALLLSMYIFQYASSQIIYQATKESQEVYTQILKGKQPNPLIVQLKSSNLLKEHNPKNYNTFIADTSNKLPINNPRWKEFLSAIDTAEIINYKIQPQISDKKIILCDGYCSKKALKDLEDQNYHSIVFSPVIRSSKNNLAVLAAEVSDKSGSSETTMYFLEKKDSGWKIIHRLFLATSEGMILK